MSFNSDARCTLIWCLPLEKSFEAEDASLRMFDSWLSYLDE